MHLVLEVEADAAVNSTAERISQDLRETLREEKIPFAQLARPNEGARLEVTLLQGNLVEQLRSLLEKDYPQLEVVETSGGQRAS